MGVIATAVVGLMSAVAGGVVKGYWEREVAIEKHRSESTMAKQAFESDLILKALQSGSTDERTKSLKFLVETNLITDPEVQKGVRQLIKDPSSIPQFILDGSMIASAKEQLIAENEELAGKTLVLIGFDARVGQLIDALAPIFAVLKPDLTLGEHKRGVQVGGDGGSEQTLLQEGYIVTGVDSYRGNYYGAEHLIHLQVYWHRLTPSGIDYSDGRISKKLANGENAEHVVLDEEFRVEPGYFVSDYQINAIIHSDGTNYVGQFEVEQQKLPI